MHEAVSCTKRYGARSTGFDVCHSLEGFKVTVTGSKLNYCAAVDLSIFDGLMTGMA
jgi:hypothetical protein